MLVQSRRPPRRGEPRTAGGFLQLRVSTLGRLHELAHNHKVICRDSCSKSQAEIQLIARARPLAAPQEQGAPQPANAEPRGDEMGQ